MDSSFFPGVLSWITIGLARHHPDCRGAGAWPDHRSEIRALPILLPVRVVEEIVDGPVHRLESDFLRQAGSSDPPCLLPHRRLIPTRVLPVVRAHVESAVNCD